MIERVFLAHDCILPTGEVSLYDSIPSQDVMGGDKHWGDIWGALARADRVYWMLPQKAPVFSVFGVEEEPTTLSEPPVSFKRIPLRRGWREGHAVAFSSSEDRARYLARVYELKSES